MAARASGLSGRAALPITTTRSGSSREKRLGSQPFCTSMPALRSWSLMGGYASVSLPVTRKPRAASMHASEPIAVPHTATKCTCWIDSIGGKLRGKEGLPHQIVQVRAQLELAALRDQVDPVGEEHDD